MKPQHAPRVFRGLIIAVLLSAAFIALAAWLAWKGN